MAATAGSPPATTNTGGPIETKPILSRHPSLCMKPVQSPPADSPNPATPSAPLSLTSKEWVIPPRPKPGRKPATDTPPTKRKAQNRAAQRAFRERRAARVGELEEQLKQIEDEHEHEEEVLKRTVDKLEKEVEQYRADLANWVDRCRRLENELVALRSSTASSLKHGESGRDKPSAVADTAINDTTVGCGNCTLETRCQCIDDAFTAMGGESATSVHQHEKRPHSPMHEDGDKRIKVEPRETMEVDFTTMYMPKDAPPSVSRLEDRRGATAAVADPCGFCSDGTPCICAEMAAEQEQAQAQIQSTAAVSLARPLPLGPTANPPRQLNQFTPPPSEGDVSMSVPAVAPSSEGGCGTSGPGTCAQCRADPNSTLFCKSLAASRAQSVNGSGTAASLPQGCCGGSATTGSCCQSRNAPGSVPLPPRTTRSRAAAAATDRVPPPKAGVTLTCADAYTTLSRHPAYERASGEIATWLPKLHANDAAPPMVGRPALEIDAANVMAVLKDFDRRFGQNR
ncbi:hypothetical protein LTR10_016253 [Elasticomyces elasticus]|uniref:BZIP domain-containing protein n=1 Tax=Exophiala sideris TaxID=1016849 RepID=A0ABR0JP18_9EURO|nr:hypothetical protein LTR10_016253 [Elasticomyces elasticus]KAK5037915.1 hypothetical protein LTS07_001382 [Exophiala sideris]KAK5043898.1 hypothetical protein LTR13_000252 [Exophiala sideris]KAK5067397.1 hypothetical protein LTR69_001384 [Exophiala sideris]KAK5182730.1 hypothetical protein LTR44_005121 [Eurotiomycetes sp. CCFEE 6388]